jgi:hypothetical protein
MDPVLRVCPNCGAPISARHTLTTCEFCRAPLMVVQPPPPVAQFAGVTTTPPRLSAGVSIAFTIGGIVFVVALVLVLAHRSPKVDPRAPIPTPMPVVPAVDAPPTPLPGNGGGFTGAGVIAMFETQCNQGDAQSCLTAGALYEHGQMGVAKDLAQARSYYERACKLGNSGACTLAKQR